MEINGFPPVFPYPINLCQPDASKSCGACCGLYNFSDHSRQTLLSLLQNRTWLFNSIVPKFGLDLYQRTVRNFEKIPPLLPDVYNCEFLGFLDPLQKKVGCLLHPTLNQGNDLRRFSFYGLELCAGHFCLSYTYLTPMEQVAVLKALDDWYLYGLVITDLDLVKEFFKEVQTRLGDSIRYEKLKKERTLMALREFFKLKENWKFAASKNRLGKYYFSRGEYQTARLEYEERWQIKPSRFDKILLSLSSDFSSPQDVQEAELLIAEKINDFLDAYLDS